MNTLPFPKDASGVPYYNNKDAGDNLAMPVEQYIRNESGIFVPISATNPQPTRDANALTKLGQVLAKMNIKGEVIIAHNNIAATATSNEINCGDFNSLLIEVAISAEKNWTFKVQGCMTSGGIFVDWHDADTGNMALMEFQTNKSMGLILKGIPNYVKIVATENEDGATVTVKVQPINV